MTVHCFSSSKRASRGESNQTTKWVLCLPPSVYHRGERKKSKFHQTHLQVTSKGHSTDPCYVPAKRAKSQDCVSQISVQSSKFCMEMTLSEFLKTSSASSGFLWIPISIDRVVPVPLSAPSHLPLLSHFPSHMFLLVLTLTILLFLCY